VAGTVLLAGGVAVAPGAAAGGGGVQQQVRSDTAPVEPTEIRWLSSDLARFAWLYRKSHKISAGRNVAVFEYVDNDGNLQMKAMASGESENNGGHSERNLIAWLKKQGIPLENVRRVYSDLEPCEIPGGYCKKAIATQLKNVREVTYAIAYTGDKASRAAAIRKMKRLIRQTMSFEHKLRQAFKGAKKGGCVDPALLTRRDAGSVGSDRRIALAAQTAAQNPCEDGDDSQVPPSGLAQELSDPGGIDFSRLELRYLSDVGSGGGLKYAFQAPATADGDRKSATGLANTQEASNAFFTWLELSPSTFWVNLNPNEPDRIIDPDLGRTDAGRVMLQADLTLKKTTGRLIHPDSELGARFWRQLSGKCLSFRTWIVPSPATVYTKRNELYILKAPLNVQMETQYLKVRGAESAVSCAEQSESVQAQNEALFRSLILPKVIKAVNTAPEYAELRRIYLSRVAAEWYRKLSERENTTYAEMIDKGDISAYTTQHDWKPIDTFNQYVESYKKGEFKVTHKTRKGDYLYTNTYIYGGVDLSNVPFTSLTAAQLNATAPDLTRNISRSLSRPMTDAEHDQVWLGGEAVTKPGGSASGSSGAADTHATPIKSGTGNGGTQWWLFLLLGAVAVLTGSAFLRQRRRRVTGVQRQVGQASRRDDFHDYL
jgi:hypothetical protein